MNAENSLALVTLMLGLLDRATQIGNLINQARAEGRDVSAAELDALKAADDVARAELVAAIEALKKA